MASKELFMPADEAGLPQGGAWLLEAFAALSSQPVPMRPDYAIQLRRAMRAEVTDRAARRGRRPWSFAFRGLFAGLPSFDFRFRPAMAAVAGLLVLAIAALFLVRLYSPGPGSQVAIIHVRAGEVHITRAVHIFGDLALTRQLNVPAGGALPLQAADALLSDQEVEAEIAFSDGSKMTVGPGAQLVVQALQARTVSRPLVIAMHLERGEVRSQVERLYRVEDRFEVSTPNLVAHVKGTVFRVDVRADGTRVATDEGVVRVNWRGQVIDVEAGQELSVLLKASVPEVHVRPQSPALVSDIPADSVVVGQNGEQTFFTYANTVSWQVRTLPGAEVEFYVNDQLAQTVRADVQGRTVVDFSPAEEGTYRITAVMATLTGEKSLPSPAQVLVIDRTPPSLLLTSPTEPQVSADSVMVAGRTEPDVRLTLNGHPVAVDEKGDFKQTLALSPGANPFTLIAIDRAGNSIKLQSVIIYELPAG